MRCVLSRRSSGLYMLTRTVPVIRPVGNTEREEPYWQPGEPIAFDHICEWAAKNIFNASDFPPLWGQVVYFRGSPLGGPFPLKVRKD